MGIEAAIIGASVIGTVGGAIAGSQSSSRAASAQTEAARQASATELEMFYKSREDLEPYRQAAQYGIAGLMGGYGMPKPNREDFYYWDESVVVDPPKAPAPMTPAEQMMQERTGDMPKRFAEYDQAMKEWQETGGRGGKAFDAEAYNRAMESYQASYTPGLLTAGPGEFKEDPGYQFRLQEGMKALERSAAARGGQLSGAQAKALQRYGQDYASGEYQNFLNRYYRSMDPYFQLAKLGAGPGMASAQQAVGVGQSLGQNALLAGQAQGANYLTQGQLWGNALGNLSSNALYSMYQQQQPYWQPSYNYAPGSYMPTNTLQSQMYTQTGAPSMYYGLLD